MTMLEAIGLLAVLVVAYDWTEASIVSARAWYRRRWHRRIGIPARDAVGQAMTNAGMPTCTRPVSKRGRVVVVEVGFFGELRRYTVDTTSPETMARDAASAVEAERAGQRGD